MSDFEKLINASDLIEWIMEAYSDWCVGAVRGIVDHVDNMPSAQPEQQWIPCSERLPEVSYDHLGNWFSPEVILLMNDEEYIQVCNGHFNPIGVFEVLEDDGPAIIGRPVEHISAWMPLPEPARLENENER